MTKKKPYPDGCEHCTSRGTFSICQESSCQYHHLWMVAILKDQANLCLEAMGDAIAAIDAMDVNTARKRLVEVRELILRMKGK